MLNRDILAFQTINTCGKRFTCPFNSERARGGAAMEMKGTKSPDSTQNSFDSQINIAANVFHIGNRFPRD